MSESERDTPSRIFISYRRDDAAGDARSLMQPLCDRFGDDRVFRDTDSIPPGVDFVKAIEKELESCPVLLVVIGDEWLTIQDPRLKQRRLDNEKDYLRQEVATALRNERVLVIPVLVQHAKMPSEEDLPLDLRPLVTRNAVELRDSRWKDDVDYLIKRLEPTLDPPPTIGPQDETDSVSADSDPARVRKAQPTGFEKIEASRQRQLAEHLATAREAFEAQDFAAVLVECEQALWIDPKSPEALTLARRAQAALTEQQIQGQLEQARKALAAGRLTTASEFIDQALVLNPDHRAAARLRKELLKVRQKRDQQREIKKQVAEALARARESLLAGKLTSAISAADDALALDAGNVEAATLRQDAVAAKEKRRLQRNLQEQAQTAIETGDDAPESIAVPDGAGHGNSARPAQDTPRAHLDDPEAVRSFDQAPEGSLSTEAAAAVAADAHRERTIEPREPVERSTANEMSDPDRGIAARSAGDDRATNAHARSASNAGSGPSDDPQDHQHGQIESRSWKSIEYPITEAAVNHATPSSPGWRALVKSSRSLQLVAGLVLILGALAGMWRFGRSADEHASREAVISRPAEQRSPPVPDSSASKPTGIGTTPVPAETGATSSRDTSPVSAPAGDVAGPAPATGSNSNATAASNPVPSAPAAAVQKPPIAIGQSEAVKPPPRTPAPAVDPRVARLAAARDAARAHYQAGRRSQALAAVVEGLAIDRNDTGLREVINALLDDAQGAVNRAKQEARVAGAPSQATTLFNQGLAKESDAATLRDDGRAAEAIQSYGAASAMFTSAANQARQASTGNAARNDIRTVLDRFRSGYIERNRRAIRDVYPAADTDTLFNRLRNCSRVNLTFGQMQIDLLSNGQAQAEVTSVYGCQPKTGQREQPGKPVQDTFRLERREGVWVIVNWLIPFG